jgi:hypothetical protein
MTPKEKAEDLIDSFVRNGYDLVMSEEMAKRCALIAVNEIIKLNINDRVFISEDKNNNKIVYSTYTVYWSEVLIEITKL